MEQLNYDYLCNDLKYLGFGEDLKNDLKESLGTEDVSFEIEYRNKIEDEQVEATLYFTRTDPEGYFFFTKYKLSLGSKKQIFYIFKGKGVTMKEGFNLLNGRSVYKQRTAKNGQKFNEWIELDLNTKDENGFRIVLYPESHGFNLSECVDALQITTPTNNWDRHMLIRSLEKGNLQTAFVKENDAQRKVHIQANPKDRTISIIEMNPPLQGQLNRKKAGDDIEDALKPRPSRAKRLKDIH